jgi:glycosyltransferase involved in cell wall biosynthesis
VLVSVVTPTLDCERWIEACAHSVRLQVQDDVEVEHIVVDGGSTDRTVQLAAEVGCRILGGDDRGLYDAANRGVRASRGELVGFLGGDDVLAPGALAAVVRRYRSSGRRWVTGSYVWTDEHLRPLGRIAAPPRWMTSEMFAALGWSYTLNMATYFERGFFDQLGGYDLDYPVAADYKLMVEAARVAPFAREPQVLALWRRHGTNESIVVEAADEGARIATAYGPAGHRRAPVVRVGMKAWVNLRNPVWSYRKLRPLPPVPAPTPITDHQEDP